MSEQNHLTQISSQQQVDNSSKPDSEQKQSSPQNTPKLINNDYEYHLQPITDLQWFKLNSKTIEIQQEKSQELVYKPKVIKFQQIV
jgi:hypothetical protein